MLVVKIYSDKILIGRHRSHIHTRTIVRYYLTSVLLFLQLLLPLCYVSHNVIALWIDISVIMLSRFG